MSNMDLVLFRDSSFLMEIGTIVNVLRGSKSQSIITKKLDKKPTYGRGAKHSTGFLNGEISV